MSTKQESKMAVILSIESGTSVCSVSITKDGELLGIRESFEGRDHARQVASFSSELLESCGVKSTDLSAVAVSMGPGSYTGLRIGVSFAKGLCHGLSIPLIGVGSLEALVRGALIKHRDEIPANATLRPMIDARRMEIYTQRFSAHGDALSEVSADVVDDTSYATEQNLVIFGDGAAKCKELLPAAKLLDVAPSALGVAAVAHEKLQRNETEDVAYFEPFYLKEVVVTKSKKRFF